jgi:hypothetical protein
MSKNLRAHRLVEQVEDDRHNDNGYWCYLKPGFVCELTDTHCVHEDTVSECLRVLRDMVVPCDCPECKELCA